jgi:hypothetical protein
MHLVIFGHIWWVLPAISVPDKERPGFSKGWLLTHPVLDNGTKEKKNKHVENHHYYNMAGLLCQMTFTC